MTVSIGGAIHQDRDRLPEPTTLLNRADDAMYEAKRAGKNAWRLAV